MVSSSLSLAPLGQLVSKKLNYRREFSSLEGTVSSCYTWRPTHGYLDGSFPKPAKTLKVVKADNKKEVVPNLEYASWVAKDQKLLSYLLNSLTNYAPSSSDIYEDLSRSMGSA